MPAIIRVRILREDSGYGWIVGKPYLGITSELPVIREVGAFKWIRIRAISTSVGQLGLSPVSVERQSYFRRLSHSTQS